MPEIIEEVANRAAIAGFVTDARSDDRLPDCEIKIAETGAQTTSDAEGFYFFLDLPIGSSLTLEVSAPGLGTRYGTASVANVTVAVDTRGVPVFDAKANIDLPPTTLTGRVKRADNNQPIAGAHVRIKSSSFVAQTDASGDFVLRAVQAGTPTVEVSAPGFQTEARRVTLEQGKETSEIFSLVAA